MKAFILIFILFNSIELFSQSEKIYEYKFTQRHFVDSILKSKKYKEGDTISINVQFKIDNEGKTNILKIDAPDEVFDNEVIYIFSKMKPFDEEYHNKEYELPLPITNDF